MKRIILSCLAVLMLGMGGCTQNTPPREEIVQEGIRSVRFSENEEDLLRLLNIYYGVSVYEFQLPQEVKKIKVDFMNLIDGEWVEVESGSHVVSDELSGKIAIRLNDNQTVSCSIQSDFGDVLVTNGFESPALNETYSAQSHTFLNGNKQIEIGKPLTLGIFYYSNGGPLHTYSTDKYDNVELFESADFVMAIRVTFLPEE